MPYLIGTDEAGYGPNFGPLCVSATVWEVDEGIHADDMYKRLRKVVTGCVDRASKKKIAWADSKAIYKNGCGLDHLERGVLTALALVDRWPCQWRILWEQIQDLGSRVQGSGSNPFSRDAQRSADIEIMGSVECGMGSLAAAAGRRQRLAATRSPPERSASATIAVLSPNPAESFTDLPWHVDYSAALPLWMNATDGPTWMSAETLADLAECVRDALDVAGVRLVAVLCRAVFPEEFNELVQASNKADVLSRITLSLVAAALESLPVQSVEVCCDRHGGRDYYLPLLQSQFEDWIEVRSESGTVSRYRFSNEQRTVDIGFYVQGERFLPVALASMTAKYVRETAMRPFNEFWCARVPGLKPTAGYPADSHRFRKQIAAVQQELEIADRILWRAR